MIHRIYLPHMASGKGRSLHGVAMAATRFPIDLARVYAKWYCVWGPSVPKHGDLMGMPMYRVPADMDRALRPHNCERAQFFNEPDLWGPARGEGDDDGYDPARAAYYWEIFERICPNTLLISPPVAWFNFEWLERFLQAFNRRYGRRPRMTGIGVHSYADLPNLIYCLDKFTDIADQWDVPEIWISEFALPYGSHEVNGARAQVNFIEPAIAYFDDHRLVKGHAWYANRTNPETDYWCVDACASSILFDYYTGEPTPAGVEYIRIGKERQAGR